MICMGRLFRGRIRVLGTAHRCSWDGPSGPGRAGSRSCGPPPGAALAWALASGRARTRPFAALRTATVLEQARTLFPPASTQTRRTQVRLHAPVQMGLTLNAVGRVCANSLRNRPGWDTYGALS
jgi:hypothetical protein